MRGILLREGHIKSKGQKKHKFFNNEENSIIKKISYVSSDLLTLCALPTDVVREEGSEILVNLRVNL